MIVTPGSTTPSKTDQPKPTAADSPPTYTESAPLVPPAMHPYNTNREPATKRFCEAFVIAVCIYIGIGIITSGISVQIHRSHGRVSSNSSIRGSSKPYRDAQYYQQDWDWYDGEVGRPLPGDGTAERCIGGNDWTSDNDLPPSGYPYPYAAHHAFKISGDIESLYMLARGSLSHGNIDIVTSDTEEDVKINVTVLYHTQNALDRASVCLVHRDLKAAGLGIFVSRHIMTLSMLASLN